MHRKFATFVATALLFLPLVAFGQGVTPPPQIANLPGDPSTDAQTMLTALILLVLGIAGLIAVAFLVFAGFRYITSAGNEDQAEAAKKTIINAIIGIVVIILSYSIVTVVINELVRRGP